MTSCIRSGERGQGHLNPCSCLTPSENHSTCY